MATEISAAGYAVIAIDLIKAATTLLEDGSSMSPEEVDELVESTKERARKTVDELREALANDPGE